MNALIDWTNFPPDVIEILLRDFNTGKKIFDGDIANVVPRALKSDDEKISRTRSIAEVFTPPHVVKFMVDAALVDSPIDSRWIEIACGEAPFITTRYDAESGEAIPVNERVGILDRKLRAIPDISDKLNDVKRAVQSVYGYELQGDSLLIARANVLLTATEFVTDIKPDELRELAEIVARNFWQMDGLNPPKAQASLFDDNDCRITDWRTGNEIFFTGGIAMKFDVLISNPAYHEDTAGTSDKPVYNYFMEEAFKVAEKAVLITPARFLFDAGKTPKDFNRRMLDDPHLKVLRYEHDTQKFFRSGNIEGGVVVTIHDTTKNYGAIGIFTLFDELNSIHRKVCVENTKFRPFSDLITAQSKWNLDKLYAAHPECKSKIGSGGNERRLTTAIFDLTEVFHEHEQAGDVKILGLTKAQRVYRYVRREFISDDDSLDKYKVFVPASNGSGAIGKVDSTPLIGLPVVGEPNEGCTQTFITVGAFDSRDEAEACLTYIKSKFARAMLGILKATQHNHKDTWAKVPLQDFSASSDIDWRAGVDEQLYRKYNLSAAEVDFIESHVKAMY